jgi:hypothetical protein
MSLDFSSTLSALPITSFSAGRRAEKKLSFVEKAKEKVKRIVQNKVAGNVFFHGTSEEAAASIRTNGMQIKKKMEGATRKTTTIVGYSIDSDSKGFHYLTKDLPTACGYAKVHKKPEVVAVLLSPSKISRLRKDPQEELGLRMSTDLSPRYVFESSSFLHEGLPSFFADFKEDCSDDIKQEMVSFTQDIKKRARKCLDQTKISKAQDVKETALANLRQAEKLAGGKPLREGDIFSITESDDED